MQFINILNREIDYTLKEAIELGYDIWIVADTTILLGCFGPLRDVLGANSATTKDGEQYDIIGNPT
jgi:hypothetical protein